MTELFLCSLLLLSSGTVAFTTPSVATEHRQYQHGVSSSRLQMIDASAVSEAVTTLSLSTSSVASAGSMVLAETEAWVQPAVLFLDPFLNLMSFAMLCRVVLSWYPENNINEFPWLIIVIPTQGLLRAVKDLVPPAFGVDITPIFWLAIFTFIHEILLGQQGLLTLKLKYGI